MRQTEARDARIVPVRAVRVMRLIVAARARVAGVALGGEPGARGLGPAGGIERAGAGIFELAPRAGRGPARYAFHKPLPTAPIMAPSRP